MQQHWFPANAGSKVTLPIQCHIFFLCRWAHMQSLGTAAICNPRAPVFFAGPARYTRVTRGRSDRVVAPLVLCRSTSAVCLAQCAAPFTEEYPASHDQAVLSCLAAMLSPGTGCDSLPPLAAARAQLSLKHGGLFFFPRTFPRACLSLVG